MRSRRVVLVIAVALATGCSKKDNVTGPPPPPPTHTGWYVTTTGSSSDSGTGTNPWDLATALGGASGKIHAGDTVWIRAGTYQGTWSPNLSGSSGNPIVVRAYPNERVIIDCNDGSSNDCFVVHGTYTYYWGLEFTNTDATRTTTSTSSNFRPDVVTNYATHTKYINLVIHDGGVALYTDTQYPDVEIYGSIIYNNGWQGPDRGHGHALYLKNNTGPIVVKDNILFNQFGYGVHMYTDSGSGMLQNMDVENNISFDNGTLSNNSTSANFGILGQEPANGITMSGNYAYYAPSASPTINVKLGPTSAANGTLTASGNHIVGGSPALQVGRWSTATISNDTVVDTSTVVDYAYSSTSGTTWSHNYYYRDTSGTAWHFNGNDYSFGDWKTQTGLGGTDGFTSTTPAATWVFVLPNTFEAGRANIVVYNWGAQASVSVPVSGILTSGDHFKVLNVQNLFGTVVDSGTYSSGNLTIPINAVNPPVPVGISSLAPNTGTAFAVFVLVKTGP